MQVDDMARAEHRRFAGLTARAAGLSGCRACGHVAPLGTTRCPLCGAAMPADGRGNLQEVWAWLLAGIILYVPANVYPMLLTSTLVQAQENTIIGGVLDLVAHGSWGVALIVFVASVVIPIGKFLVIGFLAVAVRRPGALGGRALQHLYEVVDFVGRWSMVDVFVVAILSSLVQLGVVATVNPGPAAAAFAASVVLTMLAAQRFDPRLIWDAVAAQEARRGGESEDA